MNKNKRQMVDKGQITEDILQQNTEILQENAQYFDTGSGSGTHGALDTSTRVLSMHHYFFSTIYHLPFCYYNLRYFLALMIRQ